METKQLTANLFNGWFLVDQSKFTRKKIEGTPIDVHFCKIINDAINDFISKNENKKENNTYVDIFSYSGKGLRHNWGGELPDLSVNSSAPLDVIEAVKTVDDAGQISTKFKHTPLFMYPTPYGESYLGWSLSVIYNNCVKNKEFPNRLTILSCTLTFDETHKDDLIVALEYADKFKENGTEICFAHMTVGREKPNTFPSNEMELIDSTSQFAFKIASEMSDKERFSANKQWECDLHKGSRFCITNSNPKTIKDFIQFVFTPE